MIYLNNLNTETFLKEYWQKKPLVIRKALPNFINPLSPDELAGLSLEEDVESRIVYQTPEQSPEWHLQRGPFTSTHFEKLPKTHWTLLVQGVDRLIPEVLALLDHFDFIPQWRFDDVMISYASLYGSVGPHYDNYDVFLYQAQGAREWILTSKHCQPNNYIEGLELRIMQEFEEEQRFLLQEGDMLYLPPHIGHYGIAQSEHCMTYSFGYRSYQGQELWDSLGDYLSEHQAFTPLYQDPDWSQLKSSSEIQAQALQQAKNLLTQLISDEQLLKSWFGNFATRLDAQAERLLPLPLQEEDELTLADFIIALEDSSGLERDANCRFAYQQAPFKLFINGCEWDIKEASQELLTLVANKRFITREEIQPYLESKESLNFLYDLWRLQWLCLAQN